MMKIGELADTTGVTVRTLHYYEEIGLLRPSERTPAGHRLYAGPEIERLYRIRLLKQLGIPLDGVKTSLDGDDVDLTAVIEDHLAVVDARLAAENRLRSRLVRLLAAGDESETHGASTTQILDVLEDMNMLDTNVNRPIASLVYEDLAEAFAFLTRVFGLGPGELTEDPDGNVVHGELEVGSGTLWLHPEATDFGLSSPARLGGSSASMVVLVDDVDAHHAKAVAAGAEVEYEPVDQPYGYREYGVLDLEGHLWSFMKLLDG